MIRVLTCRVLTCLVLALGAAAAVAEPFVPAGDSAVLERLAKSAFADPELRRLRGELAEDPQNLTRALDLAWRYLAVARSEGDPRWNGYAQAVLAPWWSVADPPSGVLLLRATLRQNRHEFDAALADLAQLLRKEPRNRQAWLTRAMILMVRGELQEAYRGCQVFARLDRSVLSHACLAQVASLTGRAEASYELLARVTDGGPVGDRIWTLTNMAQIAERLGESDLAESHYREALALGVRDVYLLAAYADFLLDAGRPEDVLELLDGESRSDALYLRRALAARMSGSSELEDHVRNLEARFASARLRGEETHLGSEARFKLHLLDQPNDALDLALRNWNVQKEPVDARLVLESALAAGRPEAARPVLAWIDRTGLEDVRLERLTSRLEPKKELGP